MRILHICPTARLEAPLAPESLQYLGHQIERLGAEELTGQSSEQSSRQSSGQRSEHTPESREIDVVIADACLDLSLAPRITDLLTAARITAPVIVVLGEGGLATATAKWNVSDLILTTAGPAEVEARLRVARDRHAVAGSPSPGGFPGGARSGSGGIGGNGRLGVDGGSGGWGPVRTGRGPAGTGRGTGTSGRLGEGGDGPWNADGEPMIVVTGDLRIDETAFTASLGGRGLDLTYREFALLKFLAMHPERVFTRDEILLAVWGEDYFGGTRTVDVHVRRLRAKLGKDLENAIHTVRNVGYRFSADSVTDTESEDVTA